MEKLPLLILDHGSEKATRYPLQIKRTQVREETEAKAFHGGRNFK